MPRAKNDRGRRGKVKPSMTQPTTGDVLPSAGPPAKRAAARERKLKPVMKAAPKYRWQDAALPQASPAKGRRSTGRITIADVARHVGVDASAVSLALRGDLRISEATRNRISEAAQQLGYVPNDLAKSLRGGRSRIIGVMLTDLSNHYFAGPLEEFQSMAEPAGYALSVKFSSWDMERELRGIYQFCEGRVEGIIWAPCESHTPEFAQTVARSAVAKIPIVCLGRQDQCHSIGVSVDASLTVALKYLSELGHRRVGMACATRVVGWRSNLQAQRLLQFRNLAPNFGITLKEEDIFDSSDNAYGGVGIASKLAHRAPKDRPTAVFTADDMIGRALLAGLTALNVRVPHEISVLGMDNAPGDDVGELPLTTVSLEASETGRGAMRLLLDLIERRVPAYPLQAVLLSPRLIVRSSCGPPGAP
jgi:LacI family transcriptional regulator